MVQIIELERELLADLREQSHVIDTSHIRSSQLQSYVKGLLSVTAGGMTLVFQSFAFKRGIPVDADYVFVEVARWSGWRSLDGRGGGR